MSTPEKPASRPRLSDTEVFRLIQEAAYYKAAARGFSPGYEEQDWLEAEASVLSRAQPARD